MATVTAKRATEWDHVAYVQGSGKKPYTIAFHTQRKEWGCSCPAWCTKSQTGGRGARTDCKHIEAVKNRVHGRSHAKISASAITLAATGKTLAAMMG